MDDMDQESINIGGKASFFIGDLEKYSWKKLMSVGNQERMNLYSEALIKFSQSSSLPDLFRNIFKSAFLPYRSPETLNLFLKEIDYFDYSHSEELGNAYEYLLSIMSSQGDAGQFRTPRHIIEFVVDAINPTKDDKILDPACGTAGFLISAYKHIFENHQQQKLKYDEKYKLMQNFEGYDIDPTMTRIAQVNMYLHQFKNPKIIQYDSLSQDEKWLEKFDVILANPPFMSPKGGIRPHNKFSLESNRSEVLFVDYIASHLKTNGKAGIIVPEGIIFQSGNAYKALRKSLVEDSLYAVVSLPSGVFQPYSGVKTSILFLDKQLAKKSKQIIFIKIESDGFDLGAQRRPSTKNDLPQALEILQKWQVGEKIENKLVSYVDKEKIAENDYNLSGDRYRVATDYSKAKWPMVELGDGKYFIIESGGTPDSKNEEYWNGDINWATLADLPADNHITEIKSTKRTITSSGLKNSSAKLIPRNSILVSSRATIGRIATNSVEIATNQGFKNIVIKDQNSVNYKYVALALTNKIDEMVGMANGGTFAEISKSSFSKIKIPLPPLEIQEQIASELDGYQAVIQGAKQIVSNWKPKIDIDPTWELIKLGDVCDVKKGSAITKKDVTEGSIPVIAGGQQPAYYHNQANRFKKTITVSASGAYAGFINYFNYPIFASDCSTAQSKDESIVKTEFIFNILKGIQDEIYKLQTGGGQPHVYSKDLIKIKIPLPPLEIQEQIVAQIEVERALVESAKKLIEIYEQKTKAVISKLWEE